MTDRLHPDPAESRRGQSLEIEGKWRLASGAEVARVRNILHQVGAKRLGVERERNELFDLPDRSLYKSHRILRLRVIDGTPGGRLTVKGPATRTEEIKAREEQETWVEDAPTVRAMLGLLGYEEVLVYPKTRESWKLGATVVAVDQLPFGWYCEIEGSPAEIARAAQTLRLTDPEPRGYPSLMQRWLTNKNPD